MLSRKAIFSSTNLLSFNKLKTALPGRLLFNNNNNNNNNTTVHFMSSRKAGVASPEELRLFVEQARDKLLVIDTRNRDASVEPGDQKSLAVAPLPSSPGSGGVRVRPCAQNLVWDRKTNSMPLPTNNIDKDTPIITHCGGGGRGQLAKEYLEQQGFTRVLNGGGPKETECWAVYGEK
jgi:rhodanese-related sulfurtransferase